MGFDTGFTGLGLWTGLATLSSMNCAIPWLLAFVPALACLGMCTVSVSTVAVLRGTTLTRCCTASVREKPAGVELKASDISPPLPIHSVESRGKKKPWPGGRQEGRGRGPAQGRDVRRGALRAGLGAAAAGHERRVRRRLAAGVRGGGPEGGAAALPAAVGASLCERPSREGVGFRWTKTVAFFPTSLEQ